MVERLSNLTLGIITADNYDKLYRLLGSLAIIPYRFKILIIDNSKAELELLSWDHRDIKEFVKQLGFDLTYKKIENGPSMFELRQMLLEEASSNYIWICDDDILFYVDALTPLMETTVEKEVGFVQGSKIDIYNSEGYMDFKIEVETLEYLGDIPCWYYMYDNPSIVNTYLTDCGNLMLNRKKALDAGGFKYTGVESTKDRTGEDVLIGARMSSKYLCYYDSRSVVFHFPKQKMRFVDKDPKWLLPILKNECSREVLLKLKSFYEKKFNWSDVVV